jgi:hypothetical protein
MSAGISGLVQVVGGGFGVPPVPVPVPLLELLLVLPPAPVLAVPTLLVEVVDVDAPEPAVVAAPWPPQAARRTMHARSEAWGRKRGMRS